MQNVAHYTKRVVTVPPTAMAPDVAELMRDRGVGCVVVVADDGQPLGMVTDRDLTLRVIGEGRLAGQTPAASIMSRPLRTLTPDLPLEEVVEILRANGIRRAPVVRDQELLGLVTLDDLLVALSRELFDLGEATRHEIQDAQRRARIRETRRELRERLSEGFDQLEEVGAEAKEALIKELDAVKDWLRERFS